jgi:ATP-dependent RNA helicase DeaD
MAPQQRDRSFGSAELWEPLRKAGYNRPTLLQRKVVPLIYAGRDLVVEVEGDTGRTAAFILPILVRLRRGRAGIKAVVATSSAEDSRKVEREFQRFSRLQAGRSAFVFALGAEERDRGEHRSLSKQPDVLIGTPGRIIDHIRRGNLDFSLLQSVVIDRQEPEPGFADDLKFIFSKLPPRKQVLLFSRAGPEADDLLELLRRPVHLSLAAWRQSEERVEESFIEVPQAEKPRAVAALALAAGSGALLVQTSGKDYARKMGRELAARGVQAQVLWEGMRETEQERIREDFAEGRRPVLVSTFEAVRRYSLRWVTHVLNADPPPDAQAYRPASVVLEKVISLGSAAHHRQLQEKLNVNPEKASLPDDEQVLAGAISDILRRLRAEEDPAELARYLRLLRRHAPLGRRAAVAAYLLKQVYGALGSPPATRKPQAGAAGPQAGAVPGSRAVPGARAASGGRAIPAVPRASGSGRRRRAAAEKATPPAERARAKEGFTRLFISVGKSRGVYPKDLAALFGDRLQIDRSRIGDIRVLDNYSFLEIDSALAERAIAELSGSELKGKQISVNYARKKEDE